MQEDKKLLRTDWAGTYPLCLEKATEQQYSDDQTGQTAPFVIDIDQNKASDSVDVDSSDNKPVSCNNSQFIDFATEPLHNLFIGPE
jgi:hypothetical protein